MWPGIPESYQKLPASHCGSFRYTRSRDLPDTYQTRLVRFWQATENEAFVWALFGWTVWTVINTAVVSRSLECDRLYWACLCVATVDREAAGEPWPRSVLLHQPGLFDRRPHGRQGGDADRRGLSSILPRVFFTADVNRSPGNRKQKNWF